jgi:hypothetical protein
MSHPPVRRRVMSVEFNNGHGAVREMPSADPIFYVCLYTTMNDYTFEQYDDARETRAWYERFLREHNGSDWQRNLKFSVADLLTGNLPKAPNGETTRIFWYRMKYKGVLIGYADAKIHPIFNGRKVISDMWIIPEFRKQGHFHRSFTALVEYTNAVGVCIIMPKYRLYGGWFESFGFDWLSAYGADPREDPERSVMFLITRDAYKDVVRFMIKYMDGHGYPCTERGKRVFEEVRK